MNIYRAIGLRQTSAVQTKRTFFARSHFWRLRRLGRVEAGMFAWELYEELAERAEREVRAHELSGLDVPLSSDATITDERKHHEALSKAQEMRVKQDTETTALGRTFARDADKANAFSKLSRYETMIERGLCMSSSACRPPAGRRVKRLAPDRRPQGPFACGKGLKFLSTFT